ncbi:MAG: helix-turn-helix transcriptional regulator [Planctomycetes bacterium]|nr:helix-turn-helix transcriptional regulator [Planctomycetota bacterium]
MKVKDIGKTVKTLRLERGLSTTTLARKVGISQAQISRLENGLQGFRSDTVFRIAKALRIPPFRLFMTEKEWDAWESASGGKSKSKKK